MRIRLQRGGIQSAPEDIDSVDSVVIATEQGSPICVALSMDGGNIWVKTAADPQFSAILEGIGFNKRSIPSTVETVKVN